MTQSDTFSLSSSSCILLASCMHAGTRILRLRSDGEHDGWRFEVLAKFEEHGSMNYGSDVQPLGLLDEGSEAEDVDSRARTVVSTSFYDKLLCVWRVDVRGAFRGERK